MIWHFNAKSYNTDTAKMIKTEVEFRFLRHSDGSLFARRFEWHLMRKRSGVFFVWGEVYVKRAGKWERFWQEFCSEFDPRTRAMVAGLSA